jgi:hypothetical protein
MENEHINPWARIWTQPRKTMRYILNTNPKRVIIWLAIISGILGVISLVFMGLKPFKNISHHIPLLIVAIIIGAILGVISLYFSGWLLKLTGSWIGGKGNFTEVKSAVGWSYYPAIISHIFSILQLLSSFRWLQVIFSMIASGIGVWSFFIYLGLIGEAHKFSTWKGFLTILIAFVLVVLVLIVITLPISIPYFKHHQ